MKLASMFDLLKLAELYPKGIVAIRRVTKDRDPRWAQKESKTCWAEVIMCMKEGTCFLGLDSDDQLAIRELAERCAELLALDALAEAKLSDLAVRCTQCNKIQRRERGDVKQSISPQPGYSSFVTCSQCTSPIFIQEGR